MNPNMKIVTVELYRKAQGPTASKWVSEPLQFIFRPEELHTPNNIAIELRHKTLSPGLCVDLEVPGCPTRVWVKGTRVT